MARAYDRRWIQEPKRATVHPIHELDTRKAMLLPASSVAHLAVVPPNPKEVEPLRSPRGRPWSSIDDICVKNAENTGIPVGMLLGRGSSVFLWGKNHDICVSRWVHSVVVASLVVGRVQAADSPVSINSVVYNLNLKAIPIGERVPTLSKSFSPESRQKVIE